VTVILHDTARATGSAIADIAPSNVAASATTTASFRLIDTLVYLLQPSRVRMLQRRDRMAASSKTLLTASELCNCEPVPGLTVSVTTRACGS